MKKTVQYFNREAIERAKNMSPEQIIEFLENYRKLMSKGPEKCRLISIKIEPSLLECFKKKAAKKGVPYQTMIKQLMREWIV